MAALRSREKAAWPDAVPGGVRLIDLAGPAPDVSPSSTEQEAEEARFCDEVR